MMDNLTQTAVIIEDEPLSRESLDILLKQNFSEEIKLMGYAGSVSEAVTIIEETKPDVIFTDVKLIGGTAFDFLQKITHKSFQLIFVTAYEEFALNAFKYSAIDYLLKPVDLDDLKVTIEKIRDSIPQKNAIQKQIDVLKNNLDNKNKEKFKLILPTQKEIYVIEISQIIRAESTNNYTTFYTTDKRVIMVSKNLSYYEEMLTPHNFFRIQNSHLVNLDFVFSYFKIGVVQLKDKTQLPVSIKKREELLKLLNYNND